MLEDDYARCQHRLMSDLIDHLGRRPRNCLINIETCLCRQLNELILSDAFGVSFYCIGIDITKL